MIKIFVGDVNYKLAKTALTFDSKAILIDSYTLLSEGTYYTSLGEFTHIKVFISILEQADEIIYSPPDKWSDAVDGFSYMKYWTEFYVLFFRNKKTVNGVKKISNNLINLELSDYRKTESNQLWIAGCSISNGNGVTHKQRYGQIIADKLNLPVSFLTADGSSIEWAAEQILSSDVRPGDIVVWGLTSFNRFLYYTNDVEHVSTSYYDIHKDFNKLINIDILDSEFLVYKGLSHINQVNNFCKKIGCKILIAGLLTVEAATYTKNIKNYLHLYGQFGTNIDDLFIDLGNDGKHPGPKMHEWYAEQILIYGLS